MSYPLVCLGQLAKFINGDRGKNYPSKDSFVDAGIPFINAGCLSDQWLLDSSKFNYISEEAYDRLSSGKIQKNDILFCLRGSVGKFAVIRDDNKGALASSLVILRVNGKVDIEYLKHYLASSLCTKELDNYQNGAAQPNLSANDFKKFLVPLPPLAEQRRIASILDQADELRQKRQQAIEKLDQLLQATFIDMFGDPVSNPKGWEIFKSKALFQDPPRIGTTTPANGEGIPVVRVGELGQFYIDFEKCGRVQISESDFKKYELKNGDLVLARAIGSKNQLGKCSYFSEYFEPVCIDSHVMRLRPDSEKMHPLWFYFLLSSDQGKKILQSKGGATAVQFNINSAQANDLNIALPPLSEQAKFVEIANKILKNKDSHIKSLEKNNLLFSSLQNQAFNGTL
ncbi:restriction endonuclease subunit S [Acinetobacter sp. YH12052]|uniref:restriction endonuclease subunit S n=1 Tax=Acinetobacter sp. YH12052 TaxID=2601055 RepID=UPI0015D41C59